MYFISNAEITMFRMLLTSQRSLVTREKTLFLAAEKQLKMTFEDVKSTNRRLLWSFNQ